MGLSTSKDGLNNWLSQLESYCSKWQLKAIFQNYIPFFNRAVNKGSCPVVLFLRVELSASRLTKIVAETLLEKDLKNEKNFFLYTQLNLGLFYLLPYF